MKRLLGSVVALSLMALTASATNANAEGFELVPGVVVDLDGDAIYMMRPTGGIEGLSVSSGNGLWTSENADKPLALFGNLLMAHVDQAGPKAGLEVVLLDTLGAGAVRHELRTALPEGIRAGVDDGLGRSFIARGNVLNDTPYMSWSYIESYTKGVAPAPDEPLQVTREAAYGLDLQSARLAPVEPTALAAVSVAMPAAVQAWMAAESVSEPPAISGGVIAATQVVGGMTEPSGRIVLKRWERATGAALPDVELLRGPHILQFRSADERHLLVTERVAPEEFDEYEWSVFSLETGHRLGQLRHHQSHARFFVAGSTIVFEEPAYGHLVNDEVVDEPRRLRAAVLGSGSTVWERELRDTAYRGPYPP